MDTVGEHSVTGVLTFLSQRFGLYLQNILCTLSVTASELLECASFCRGLVSYFPSILLSVGIGQAWRRWRPSGRVLAPRPMEGQTEAGGARPDKA